MYLEYLIDTAESCIRDTALSGWTDNRLSFLISIEIFVNGFYFEIIHQLKNFFGDKQLLALKVQPNLRFISSNILIFKILFFIIFRRV